MKTVLYWFSGSGNSLATAKLLAEFCGGETELLPVATALSGSQPPADRIGLVFPVYGWGPPAIVSRFIKRMKEEKDTPIFAVATCAKSAGGTLSVVQRLLQQRGLDLAAGWTVVMPENYPPLGGAPAPEKQQAIQQAAEEKIRSIAEALRSLPPGTIEQSAALWQWIGRIVHPLFCRHVARADRSFRASSQCNGCGLCAQVCPVENIEINEGRPRWMGHCEQCFACFHWCPQQAVQFGRSQKQRRYHHPESTLAELMVRKKPAL